MNRAADLKHMLAGARHPGESQKAYRNRRVLAQVSVDKHLRGRMAYVSSQTVTLPPKGRDEQVDDAVLRGLYRDLTTRPVKSSIVRIDLDDMPTEVFIDFERVGRTKGKTYKRPTPKTPSLRDQWRAR